MLFTTRQIYCPTYQGNSGLWSMMISSDQTTACEKSPDPGGSLHFTSLHKSKSNSSKKVARVNNEEKDKGTWKATLTMMNTPQCHVTNDKRPLTRPGLCLWSPHPWLASSPCPLLTSPVQTPMANTTIHFTASYLRPFCSQGRGMAVGYREGTQLGQVVLDEIPHRTPQAWWEHCLVSQVITGQEWWILQVGPGAPTEDILVGRRSLEMPVSHEKVQRPQDKDLYWGI
jgi:hypothetical protein